MAHIFKSSRITTGNAIFPITIVIDNDDFYCYKGHLLGSSTLAMSKKDIASVGLFNGIIFSDIIIETNGGGVYRLNGFSRSDAKKIYMLLHRRG